MSVNRLFQGILFLSVVGLIGTHARAEPMLLIEIHDEATSINLSHFGAPVYMALLANGGNGSPPVATLEGFYDSDDVGMTFHATPVNVDAFEAALSVPTGEFGIITSNTSPGPAGDADDLWHSDPQGFFRQFAPRLGVGLTGYDLTDVTQTIDHIEYRTTGANTHVALQEQTFRFYGQPIPEPQSAVLLFAFHICLIAVRRR
jgi:hypothetical protein